MTATNRSIPCWPPYPLFGRCPRDGSSPVFLGADDRILTGSGAASSYQESNQISMLPHVHMGTVGLNYHATSKDALTCRRTTFAGWESRRGSGLGRRQMGR